MNEESNNPLQTYSRFPAESLQDAVMKLISTVSASERIGPTSVFLEIASMIGYGLGHDLQIIGLADELLCPNLQGVVLANRHSPRRLTFRALAEPLLSLEKKAAYCRDNHAAKTREDRLDLKTAELKAALRLGNVSSAALQKIVTEFVEAAASLQPPLLFEGWERQALRSHLDRQSGSVWWPCLSGFPGRDWSNLPSPLRVKLERALQGVSNRNGRSPGGPAVSFFAVADPDDAAPLVESAPRNNLILCPIDERFDDAKRTGAGIPMDSLEMFVYGALATRLRYPPTTWELDEPSRRELARLYDDMKQAERTPGPGRKTPLTFFVAVALKLMIILKFVDTPEEKPARKAAALARHLAWSHLQAISLASRESAESGPDRPSPEDLMLERIRKITASKGPPTFRELRRTFKIQTKERHLPTLENLIESGLVRRDGKGRLHASPHW